MNEKRAHRTFGYLNDMSSAQMNVIRARDKVCRDWRHSRTAIHSERGYHKITCWTCATTYEYDSSD